MKLKMSVPCAIAMLLLAACSNNDSKKKVDDAQSSTTAKKDSVVKTNNKVVSVKPPVINIMDTLSVKRIVLCLKDSAAAMEGIGAKLGVIYGKISKLVKDNKLNVTGAPTAWYKTDKAPYFFEAGLPVDKKPAKIPAGVIIKEIMVDSVIVAHFFGPYNLMPQGYTALKEFMTDHKKKANGAPYEIYIGDPGVEKDPYKVQTDIVFPVK